jgi:hypothetical protein
MILNLPYQRINIVIAIYAVRVIPNSIVIGINVDVIIPVVAEVVSVCSPFVGVGYFGR